MRQPANGSKQLVILGAGTAGTMIANKIVGDLPDDWNLVLVDPAPEHLYQPGLLFLPFGARDEAKMVRSRRRTLRPDVTWLGDRVEAVDTDKKEVVLKDQGAMGYDLLVVATGSEIQPTETEGMLGPHWHESVFDFYTLQGAVALRDALAGFDGGRLVLNVVEMPIKCPVAPLEFLFLADAYFTQRGIRDQVELVYATPLDGAFTKPVASKFLGRLLDEKGIRVESEFSAGSVDGEGRILSSWDERAVPYDLLVTVPTHMGADFLGSSGLGDELNFVPTEPHSLRAMGHDDVFVLGDATNLPSSKAGSVAHFQADVVTENILRTIADKEPVEGFDGHSNCFVETGYGKALLIDFNYDIEPLPGTFPLPYVGPMTLLKESRRNHWGKLAFRWVYWNALLPGRQLPVSNRMSMLGKKPAAEALRAAA